MAISTPRPALDLPPNQLRTFLKVARRLSFTRAAEELHLTQPAVSAHIRKLERAIGGVVYRYAEQMLALESELQAAVDDRLDERLESVTVLEDELVLMMAPGHRCAELGSRSGQDVRCSRGWQVS